MCYFLKAVANLKKRRFRYKYKQKKYIINIFHQMFLKIIYKYYNYKILKKNLININVNIVINIL